MRITAVPIFAVLLIACCSPLQLTRAVKATDEESAARDVGRKGRYEKRTDHDPNGIGKFYMGREIAHVMGFGPGGQGADWLERPSREEEERLTLLVRSLQLKPGDKVADIGAGSGVVSLRMSEPLLPDGKVFAVDVQDEMLDRLKSNCRRFGINNIEPVKGTQIKTGLKPRSVDMAVMVDVYHEFEFPYEMMTDIAASMKPGGRVVLVEYRGRIRLCQSRRFTRCHRFRQRGKSNRRSSAYDGQKRFMFCRDSTFWYSQKIRKTPVVCPDSAI